MRNAMRRLGGVLCVVGLAGCEGGAGNGPDPVPTATPAPPPIVLREGAVGIPTASSVRFVPFTLDRPGTLQVGFDWVATGDATNLFARVVERSYAGDCAPTCDAHERCSSSCRRDTEEGWTERTHPVTVRSSRLPAGTYELHITYYDPLDYLIPWHPDAPPRVQVSYQIVLLPSAAARAGAIPGL
jgi:hypothetical protein